MEQRAGKVTCTLFVVAIFFNFLFTSSEHRRVAVKSERLPKKYYLHRFDRHQHKESFIGLRCDFFMLAHDLGWKLCARNCSSFSNSMVTCSLAKMRAHINRLKRRSPILFQIAHFMQSLSCVHWRWSTRHCNDVDKIVSSQDEIEFIKWRECVMFRIIWMGVEIISNILHSYIHRLILTSINRNMCVLRWETNMLR